MRLRSASSAHTVLQPAFAAMFTYLLAFPVAAQSWDPFGAADPDQTATQRSFRREDLAPPPAFEETQRGVEKEELDPVMAADGSGLPHELWNGLSAEQFAQSVAALELPPRSPVLHALWKRLIGSDTVPVSGTDSTRFTALRAEALEQTGLVDEVTAVLARDPASGTDPLLMALTARNEIGLGNPDRGCEIGKRLLPLQAKLPKPVQGDVILINGFCAATHDDLVGAGIQAGLLRELDLGGAGADLLDAVAGELKPELPKEAKLSLLDYRIAALGGAPDVQSLVRIASPALLGGLTRDPHAAADLKLAAGEAAAKLNVISAQDLAALYRADGAGSDAGTLERARLFKAALAERSPLKKARLIQAFIDEAQKAGLSWPALQLMEQPLQSLAPAPEIGWFAEAAVEIHLAAGSYEAARTWARVSDVPGAASDGAQPLAHWIALADIADPAKDPASANSLAALASMDVSARFEPALLHRLIAVLDALGMPAPAPLWDLANRSAQPASGHLPDTGVLSQLADASQKKQFGRTVLLAMRTIGPEGPQGAHMIALGDALRALNRAGLKAEARQMALEGLLFAWPRSVAQ